MKGTTKTSPEKVKRSAEDWVDVARGFGERCVAIQQDPHLSLDQKLEKQRNLSKQMIKEIQDDPHLDSKNKTIMVNSLKSYMDDWTKLHDTLQLNQSTESEQPTTKKKKK